MWDTKRDSIVLICNCIFMYCNMAFMFICSYLTLVCHIHRLATISLMSSIGETSNTIFLESQVFNKVLSESKHLSYFILLFWVYIWYGGKTLVLLLSCCSLSCLIYLGFCLQPLLYFTSKFIRMLHLGFTARRLAPYLQDFAITTNAFDVWIHKNM